MSISLPFSMTVFTYSTSIFFNDASIFFGILMSVWTMSFLSIIYTSISSLYIFLGSDWFKIVRIYTSSITTQMIKRNTIWNWLYKEFIGEPYGSMRYRVLSLFSLLFFPVKTTISIFVYLASPDPTTTFFFNKLHKAFYDCWRLPVKISVSLFSVKMHPAVFRSSMCFIETIKHNTSFHVNSITQIGGTCQI